MPHALKPNQMNPTHLTLRRLLIARLIEKPEVRRQDVTKVLARHNLPQGTKEELKKEIARLRLMANTMITQLIEEGVCTQYTYRPPIRPKTGSGQYKRLRWCGQKPVPGSYETVEQILVSVSVPHHRKHMKTA